jgi:hypothetical protein
MCVKGSSMTKCLGCCSGLGRFGLYLQASMVIPRRVKCDPKATQDPFGSTSAVL